VQKKEQEIRDRVKRLLSWLDDNDALQAVRFGCGTWALQEAAV
jgi:hypothetical protein